MKAVILAALAAVISVHGSQTKTTDPDKVLAALGRMTGGTWESAAKNADGTPLVRLSFAWLSNHKGIAGSGRIADMDVHSSFGLDPKLKMIYYLDCHGHDTVYFGHYWLENGELWSEFSTLVGDQGEFRTHARLVDDNHYTATIMGRKKDGTWVDLHPVQLTRH